MGGDIVDIVIEQRDHKGILLVLTPTPILPPKPEAFRFASDHDA